MYVRLQSSYQIVSLPEDFLTLKKVEDDYLIFELKYLFDQEIGIKKNITKVTVEVAKDNPPTLAAVSNMGKNTLLGIQRFKSLHTQLINKHKEQSVILELTSDPTKSINNEVVSLYNRGYITSQIPQLNKNKLVPVLTADAVNPIVPINAQHDLAVKNDTQQQVAEELILLGHDPSSAYALNDLGLSLAESYRGIHRKSPSVFVNTAEKALYKYKNLPFLKPILQSGPGEQGVVVDDDASSDMYVLERARIDGRHVIVKETLKFKIDSRAADKLILTLKVKDKEGVTVQQLDRVFYPREYVKYFSIPTKPPIVKLSANSGKTYATLAIKQIDSAASRVRLYKRVYNHHEVSDDPFVFVTEFDLATTDGWKYMPVEMSLGNSTIYRVVPVNELGVFGSDFTSVVVKPKMTNPTIKRVVITTKAKTKSVLLEVSKLPSDTVSFQIMRENVTVNKGALEFIKSPILVETADPNRIYTLEDDSVKRNHVYAYHCRIYRRSGSCEQRLAAYYEHVPLVENIVETKLSDPTLTLTNTGYDVTFQITTTVVKSNVDQVKFLLEKQGLYEIFSNDVAEVRDQLSNLVAHNIKRIDLTTGQVEDFGTVDTDSFSDLTLRNITGVSELRSGRRYRYVVTALLRAPETLLESYIKTETDEITNRLYTYKPFKFLHPIVSQYGNIVTPSSIRKNYSKDPMTFGEIGAYTIVEVEVDKEKSSVVSAIREKRGTDVDVLTWVLQGNSKDVDHFQVITERDGKRTVSGKATCVPETNNFLYVRRLDQTEVGLDIRYYICPVYHDFSRGVEASVANSGESQ